MEDTTQKSYSIEKLNEKNYRSWSQVIESHLDDQDLWELVNGTEPKPAPIPVSEGSEEMVNAVELEAWAKKAKKARKLIISTISASVMTYVEGEKNPATMWTILDDRYNQRPESPCVSSKDNSTPSK